MIDADIAGEAGAHRQFALDATARRHYRIVGKQHCAYFAILVAPAGITQQGAVLFPPAEFPGRHEAASPEPAALVPGAGFVVLETSSRVGFEVQGQPLTNHQCVQASAFTLDAACTNVPLLVGTRAQVLAAHLAVANQLGELLAGLDAAGPGVGMLVDADLVQFRGVDAVEPVGHIAQLKGAAIPDDRARREALARRDDGQYQD